jgi:inosine-uridine nucleoside N-ribohydrolase
MTLPILLDCDPGNDDALGILVAAGHAGLDLKAVTTGAGHLAGERTARNAAITLELARKPDIPVAGGNTGPLVRERLIAGVLDMDSALDPERDDLPARRLDDRHSVDLIIETVRSGTVSTIVTSGPQTNIALALRRAPDIAAKLQRIIILGGSWGLGNKTAAAEWNILCDPEAAAIVFDAGVPITMLPIDALVQVGITPDLIDRTAAIGGRIGDFSAELLTSLVGTFRSGVLAPAFMPLNDPVASLVAADPALVKTVPARVDVELAGRHTYGRTVVDFAMRGGTPPNADVVIRFDRERVENAFVGALERLAKFQDLKSQE